MFSATDKPPSPAFLTRALEHAQTLHERFFCHLWLPHLQLDELRTRLRSYKQVLWLWLAIDPCTRDSSRPPVGPPHTTHGASAHPLPATALGRLSASRSRASDGLKVYFSALTAHFGHWREVSCRGRHRCQWQVTMGLISGQVKKSYRRRKLVRVTHVMRLGTQADLTGALQRMGLSGRLNTAFIEPVNLTVRHGVAALARRTWATSQQASQLLAHVQWWRA